MTTETIFFDKLFQVIPGPIFGLLSVVVGVCGDILSALHKPGYNISRNMISELGVGPGAIFFNIGVITAGILSIPFMVYLSRTLLE